MLYSYKISLVFHFALYFDSIEEVSLRFHLENIFYQGSMDMNLWPRVQTGTQDRDSRPKVILCEPYGMIHTGSDDFMDRTVQFILRVWVKTPDRDSKSGLQTGTPSRDSRLGLQIGSPNRESKLGVQTGSPDREFKLGVRTGSPSRDSRPERWTRY